MKVKSVTDKRAILWPFLLILLTSLLSMAAIWSMGLAFKSRPGYAPHLLVTIGLMGLAIGLPVWSLQRMLTVYTIIDQEIRIASWFGLRRKTYSLLPGTRWQQKGQTVSAFARSQLLPKRYYEFDSLTIHTIEGKKIRIDSRYIKNLNELARAVKRAVSKRG